MEKLPLSSERGIRLLRGFVLHAASVFFLPVFVSPNYP